MGKCKVKDSWLECEDANGYKVGSWARKVSDNELQCVVCDSVIKVDGGQYRISQHAGMKTHINNCKIKLSSLQLHLEKKDLNPTQDGDANQAKVVNLNMVDTKKAAVKAELIWTVKTVLSHTSLNSNSDITDVFTNMFGQLSVGDFSLSPAKMMYLITEALGPYFRQKMLKQAENSFYTIGFDETTNDKSQKELQISLRYWSESEGVVEKHLRTYFIGRATAEILHEKILSAIQEANLPLKKMLMISCDGPNVNKKLLRLFNETVLEIRSKSLVDIGTCSLHKVHNAFLKGLEEMGNDVADLIIAIFYYFDGWPARFEEYAEIQSKVGVPGHRFIKHVPSRWLTVGPAAERVVEQWPALQKYYLKHIPQHSSKQADTKKYKDIVKMLKEPDMRAKCLFVIESADFFTAYTRFFQSEGPLIHRLYETGMDLVQKLANRVLTGDKKDIPLKEIPCGDALKTELSSLNERDQLRFGLGMRKHYTAAVTYLKEQLNLESQILKDCRCVDIGKFKDESSESQILRLAKALPFERDSKLLDEWKMLKQESIPEEKSLIEHWKYIFDIKSPIGHTTKYPNVTKVVKCVLSLSHGSASIERGFSASGNLLTSDKTAMTERGINARLDILSGMKKYNNKVSLLPITNELMVLARHAHQSYKTYLEEEKAKKQKKKMDEEAKTQEKQILHEKKEIAKDLKSLSKELLDKKKEEMEKRSAADKLLDEATKRLASGIKRKNTEEITLAQGMLQGVKALRTTEVDLSDSMTSITKKIEKKSSKISSYFERKSKN